MSSINPISRTCFNEKCVSPRVVPTVLLIIGIATVIFGVLIDIYFFSGLDLNSIRLLGVGMTTISGLGILMIAASIKKYSEIAKTQKNN